MSDFIYSAAGKSGDDLSQILQICDPQKRKSIVTKEGPWGAVAFFENHYKNNEWVETKDYVAILLGGPVVKGGTISTDTNNTQKIVDEWLINENKTFDEYIDGPFLFCFIDKTTHKISVITDLMGFIPMYYTSAEDNGALVLSSHIDAAAKASGRLQNIDHISFADLVLNKTIAFPYTLYKEIFQAHPASYYAVNVKETNIEKCRECYWLPEEKPQQRLDGLARELKKSFQWSVTEITNGKEKAALLVSGGEDSRILMNAVPKEMNKTGHLFLDDINRELGIAKKVTAIYGIETRLCMRPKSYYLDQWTPASLTGGSSSPAYHAHAYGINDFMHLDDYDVVLGGLGADAYLKGSRVRNVHKYKLQGIKYRLDTLDSENNSSDKFLEAKSSRTPLIKEDMHQLVYARRKKHKDYIKIFRPNSAGEWSELWPASMNESMANFFVHRRIFRSYEPFLQNEVMKVAASAPQEIKINRRLFHSAFKKSLKKSWHVSHTKGLLPYFSTKTNFSIMAFIRLKRAVEKAVSNDTANQDSWADFDELVKNHQSLLEEMLKDLKVLSLMESIVAGKAEEEKLLNELKAKEVLMLLQTAVIQQQFAEST